MSKILFFYLIFVRPLLVWENIENFSWKYYQWRHIKFGDYLSTSHESKRALLVKFISLFWNKFSIKSIQAAISHYKRPLTTLFDEPKVTNYSWLLILKLILRLWCFLNSPFFLDSFDLYEFRFIILISSVLKTICVPSIDQKKRQLLRHRTCSRFTCKFPQFCGTSYSMTITPKSALHSLGLD